MKRSFFNRSSLPGLVIFIFLFVNLHAQEIDPWWKNWKKNDNPLFGISSGENRSDPVVIYDEGKYKMWVTFIPGLADPRIVYSESDDGQNWSDGVVVIPSSGNQSDWDYYRGAGTVLRINDTLKMWYCGQGQTGWWNSAIGYAWSLDGLSWNPRQMPVLQRSGPQSWDCWNAGPTPGVYYDGTIYHMFYSAITDSTPGTIMKFAIGYAYSGDGIHWTKDPRNEPVINLGPYGSFNQLRSYSSQVFNYKDTLRMLFQGFDGTSVSGACYYFNMGYAYSTDNGWNWTVTGDTSLAVGDSGTWDMYFVGNPSIIFHKGYFRMWYMGKGIFNQLNVGYAHEDVLCFTGGVTFSSQDDIDNFEPENPGCRVIEGDVVISGSNITNLEGLSSLGYINGSLKIQNNPQLTSLSGLQNIETESVSELWITNNPQLSYCAVKSICDYLVSPSGSYIIFNNSAGCNNALEIMEDCFTSTNEKYVIKTISIYPNPVQTELFLSGFEDKIINEVNIYNILGQKVLNSQQGRLPIDVTMLPQGIYLLEAISGNTRMIAKFMK
jgi:hypothetical protein